ncbi:MAG: tRNA (adenosine(37)-N6)-threonylcarbamoyltransferase complex dimerization subunit type 1 TsaB [Chloroflexi bacterium]|nr:tRNA (adenosine(37)-N6)-threonylcarbamoyltransferase complex dimerization subunit type 1 TsaB [Chloroflexota bacterium]
MLLAIDTSTTRAGIALYDGDVLAEVVWQAGRDHGRHLMPLVEQTLLRVGRRAADLTGVVAARGPGSFTGLRVGLSVARGLQLGLGIPLYGVGSLDVLANGLPPMTYPVQAVLAAGRGRFATARFEHDGHCWTQVSEVVGVTLDSLVRLASSGLCCVVGDLDAAARAALAELGERVYVAPPALSVRRPAVLAALGWWRLNHNVPPSADEGEPIYLVRQ